MSSDHLGLIEALTILGLVLVLGLIELRSVWRVKPPASEAERAQELEHPD